MKAIIYEKYVIPTYPSLYDRVHLALSLIFNAQTIWNAWKWQDPDNLVEGGE